MTTWTKTTDTSTSWVEEADVTTSYTEIEGSQTPWGLFGGLIRLCTEGLRDDLMTEDREDYIVVSHGEDVEIWTDTADNATTWTKITDI